MEQHLDMSWVRVAGDALPRPARSQPPIAMPAESSREFTTVSQAFWPGLDFLNARGLAANALLGPTGYEERDLREPDRRIPRRAALAMLRALSKVSREPALGFALAAFVKSETFDLLDYMARASATLRDAMSVSNRYARIVDDSCHFAIQTIDGRVTWRLDMDWPADVEPVVVEFLLGVLGIVGRRLFRGDVPIEEIWVRWREPQNRAAYVRVFGFPVRFEAPYNAILFPPGILDAPLSGADPALAKLLERQAETLLASLPCVARLSDQVKSLLTEELHGREPSMHCIARRLGTTPSTLRRRLSAEGTTFKRLLELTRLELARACLADRRMTINETAFLLGYSDVSTFFKFFRRSTGRTPAQYRREARGALTM
jgi:AraC-like DNA-binding protein